MSLCRSSIGSIDLSHNHKRSDGRPLLVLVIGTRLLIARRLLHVSVLLIVVVIIIILVRVLVVAIGVIYI